MLPVRFHRYPLSQRQSSDVLSLPADKHYSLAPKTSATNLSTANLGKSGLILIASFSASGEDRLDWSSAAPSLYEPGRINELWLGEQGILKMAVGRGQKLAKRRLVASSGQ
jgi:hypothetical protein